MLPKPSPSQAYCKVSALEAGFLALPDRFYVDGAPPTACTLAPSLSFLLVHTGNHQKFIFDLGIRKDWDRYSSEINEHIKPYHPISVPKDVVDSLARDGTTTPKDISTVCLSHTHWDHVGDSRPFTDSIFVLGEPSRSSFAANTDGEGGLRLPPLDRTRFITHAEWAPVGPFPRAFDYYGDSSVYIVDAPGHMPGHVNVLARTSGDGAWILLAGDSAHRRDIIMGEGEVISYRGLCAHADKAQAESHIDCIRALRREPRLRVLLAHDVLWFEEQKAGASSSFWPGTIPSL